MSRLLLVVALATTLTPAAPLGASVTATAFHAQIEDKLIRPDGACPDGAFRCGDAEIEGFGAAEWRFYLMSFARESAACGSYTSFITFTLADGSVLSLEEAGTVCAPGKSFFATPGFSWGNPDAATGTWEFVSGTGQFAAITGGDGQNHAQSAGAAVSGVYTGSLQD